MEYKIRSVVVKHPGVVPILYLSNIRKPGSLPGLTLFGKTPVITKVTIVTFVMTNATEIIIVIMDSILFSFN